MGLIEVVWIAAFGLTTPIALGYGGNDATGVPPPVYVTDTIITGDFSIGRSYDPNHKPESKPSPTSSSDAQAHASNLQKSGSSLQNASDNPLSTQPPGLVPELNLQDIRLDANSSNKNIVDAAATIFGRWNTAEQEISRTQVPLAIGMMSDTSVVKLMNQLQSIFAQASEEAMIPALFNILLGMDFQKYYHIHNNPQGETTKSRGDNLQAFVLCELLSGHLTAEMAPDILHAIERKQDIAFLIAENDALFNAPQLREAILSAIRATASRTYSKSTKQTLLLRALRSKDPTIRNDLPDLFANSGGDAYDTEIRLRPLLLMSKDYRTSQTTALCLDAFLPHVTDPGIRSNVNFDLSLMGQLQAINAVLRDAADPNNPAQQQIVQRIAQMCEAFKIPYKGDLNTLRRLRWDPATAMWTLPPG